MLLNMHQRLERETERQEALIVYIVEVIEEDNTTETDLTGEQVLLWIYGKFG